MPPRAEVATRELSAGFSSERVSGEARRRLDFPSKHGTRLPQEREGRGRSTQRNPTNTPAGGGASRMGQPCPREQEQHRDRGAVENRRDHTPEKQAAQHLLPAGIGGDRLRHPAEPGSTLHAEPFLPQALRHLLQVALGIRSQEGDHVIRTYPGPREGGWGERVNHLIQDERGAPPTRQPLCSRQDPLRAL